MSLNKYFEKQPNGYLKYIGDKFVENQLNLFCDYTRFKYTCLKCGYVWENTYSTYKNCIKCKSEYITPSEVN